RLENREMRTRNAVAGAAVIAALSWSCVKGPNYKKPVVLEPTAYRGALADQAVRPDVVSLGDQKWWDVFQDDALRALIRAALDQNYDVRIAAARILEARALLGIVRADQLPEVNGSGSTFNERLPEAAGRPALVTSQTQVGISAAWELDFWGKFRRATESAR